MKPIIIKNEKLLDRLSIVINIGAITLYPFIIHRGDLDENEYILNHEKIHLKQQAELLVVFFYLLYAAYYLIGLVKYRDKQKAYFMIPFEQEAYEYDDQVDYLEKRKLFTWTKYKV